MIDGKPEPETGPEDREEETGAEGGTKSPSYDRMPGAPSDDGTALGDTDQHSDAPGPFGTG